MWVRERRLRFENLEQRKQFAGDGFAEPFLTLVFDTNAPSETSEVQGVRAAEVRIQFDPLTVQPDLNTIKAGDAWNGKASVVANVDEAAGTLVAFLFTTLPIAGQGSLLELEFKSAGSVPVDGSSPSIGVETVRLNEGAIAVTSDLTVLSAPPKADRDVTFAADSAFDADSKVLAVEELHAIDDALTERSIPLAQIPDHEDLDFVLGELRAADNDNPSPVACDQRDDRPSAVQSEPHNRLHDMSVTGVFFGPVLPEFLEG